jgi:S-DNA-T family DNA segregation ATPase FtsK/SpoIIIE
MFTLAELRVRPDRQQELAGFDLLAAASHEVVLEEGAGRADALVACVTAETVLVPVRRKAESFWDQVTVGRAPTCDLVLDDPAVSSVHAHFELGAGGRTVGLVDLGSSNGTRVEGRAIAPHVVVRLGHGDCVRFGQTVFYFLDHGALAALL